ncbi:MAG: hypothetical protein GQ534_05175 [Candidatus Delongbacteria bacterium]|nr:hypothetical protein [Candidatus Delongbacteria bacterium]
MFLKIIDINYKDDIFLALESVEITKASYIEASNLEKSLTDELPLFKGFFTTDEEKEKQIIIVTALIDSTEQIDEMVKILEASGLNIRDEKIFRLALMPVSYVFDPTKD